MSKPFFVKIDIASLLNFATDPDGENMTILKFAKELQKGKSDIVYIQSIIDEAYNYIEKKKNAGKKGGEAKASSAKAVLKQCYGDAIAEPSTPLANSSSSSKDLKNLSSSKDEVEENFYLSKKGKKLTGKRLETFERFWAAFGYKQGKAEAADAWMAIPMLTDAITDKIVAAAQVEATRRTELLAQGKTPKMAQGWLSGRRWEDEQEARSNMAGVK